MPTGKDKPPPGGQQNDGHEDKEKDQNKDKDKK